MQEILALISDFAQWSGKTADINPKIFLVIYYCLIGISIWLFVISFLKKIFGAFRRNMKKYVPYLLGASIGTGGITQYPTLEQVFLNTPQPKQSASKTESSIPFEYLKSKALGAERYGAKNSERIIKEHGKTLP